MGSLKEVECQIFLAKDLEYISQDIFDKLINDTTRLGRKLLSFIDYIRGSL